MFVCLSGICHTCFMLLSNITTLVYRLCSCALFVQFLVLSLFVLGGFHALVLTSPYLLLLLISFFTLPFLYICGMIVLVTRDFDCWFQFVCYVCHLGWTWRITIRVWLESKWYSSTPSFQAFMTYCNMNFCAFLNPFPLYTYYPYH